MHLQPIERPDLLTAKGAFMLLADVSLGTQDIRGLPRPEKKAALVFVLASALTSVLFSWL